MAAVNVSMIRELYKAVWTSSADHVWQLRWNGAKHDMLLVLQILLCCAHAVLANELQSIFFGSRLYNFAQNISDNKGKDKSFLLKTSCPSFPNDQNEYFS